MRTLFLYLCAELARARRLQLEAIAAAFLAGALLGAAYGELFLWGCP